MKTIDLNCDMGECFGRYKLGLDEEVIKEISSANVACGWHAGDPLVMNQTVAMASEHKVGIGAHPGYPDLLGFGRRNMDCTLEEVKNYVIYQIGALQAFCMAHQTRLQHVKPHGNLEVIAEDGSKISLEVHTLCVHGDTPTAVELVKQIRRELQAEGLKVTPIREFL